ncbi:hypothetical protein Aduo_013166 [Ancylostoma duodenale]
MSSVGQLKGLLTKAVSQLRQKKSEVDLSILGEFSPTGNPDQMKKLSEHPAATGTLKVIRSKFPDRTLEKVGELRRKGDPSWTVDDLLQALDAVVEQLEVTENTDPRIVHYQQHYYHIINLSLQREAQDRGTLPLLAVLHPVVPLVVHSTITRDKLISASRKVVVTSA